MTDPTQERDNEGHGSEVHADSGHRRAIIISASSDIGDAIARRWLNAGWKVFGTFRTESDASRSLTSLGMPMVVCDLSQPDSVASACTVLRSACGEWDVLAMCPGTLSPVGPFLDCDLDEWEASVRVNFIATMRVVHALLPFRNVGAPHGPCVLFFSGGGTNSAPTNYSAYNISKIALIKMCEFLDAEIPDTRFVVLGPGWVKTKIHQETMEAGPRAGDHYDRVIRWLERGESTPMERILDCCDWVVNSAREVVGGRNFSVVFDAWDSESLRDKLLENADMYKLRRSGNEWRARD